MFDAVEGLVAEHADLEGKLAAPETHADQRLAKRLNQRYAELSAIVRTWREWQELGDDIGAARELASEDAGFAEEAEALTARRADSSVASSANASSSAPSSRAASRSSPSCCHSR